MKTNFVNTALEFIKRRRLVLLAVAGAVLLLISFFGKSADQKASKENITAVDSYADETQEQLKEVISEMLGDRRVRVMITLDSAAETVYADITKINQGHTENTGADQNIRTEQKDSKENEYIIVKDHDGNEKALVVTTVMPQIRGVVVVCPNGNEAVVQAMVKSAVVTALNISEKKVCVVGLPT